MTRATFRIYLGAAPGVGKTHAMLNEGWRRRERGADVVIGIVETHGRANTAEQVRNLEIVAKRGVEYRGATLAEMDIDAILARKPELCLVDELAHTNAPGSRNEKRWQDVIELLDAGIEVISTVNVQHLESLNDVVERITGVVQRETVPDSVVRGADQIELVDMSPEALRRRMAHGNIYPAERIDTALGNYFRPGNLGALRELALMWVADRVEESLQGYLEAHSIADAWETRERIVVAISGAQSSDGLIRRGGRIATRTRGELLGVHISRSDGLSTRGTSEALEPRRRLLEELGGKYQEIVSDEPSTALVEFAQSVRATQLVVGASAQQRLRARQRNSFVQRVIARAGTIDVHVIGMAPGDDPGERPESSHGLHLLRERSVRSVNRRRRRTAAAISAVGLPLLTLILSSVRSSVGLPTVLLAFLTLVLAVAAVGGRRVSLLTAVVAALIENWFFVTPLHTFSVNQVEDVVAIVMFLLVAGTVGTLVERAAQRADDALRARTEAEAFARTSATLASDPNPIPELVEYVRATFGFASVAVLTGGPADTDWQVVAASGYPVPVKPSDGTSFPLRSSESTPDHVLVLTGRALNDDDRRVMAVFTTQFALGLENARLGRDAEHSAVMTEVDATRTALLQAVSHDLRSPLAAIKTYVTGLRADDVTWSAEQVAEGLAAIDEETDRLNRLVGNLLDAGRLQAGTTAMHCRPTPIAEVVSSALNGLVGSVDVRLSGPLPMVMADPALLERSLANVVSNALRYQRKGEAVVVDGAAMKNFVYIRVVDRGPGIAVADRQRVLAPFQRLGDRHTSEGVGLGLSIATGFVTAMGGTFALDDTPGGGLTVTIGIPAVVGSSNDSVMPLSTAGSLA